MIVISAILTKRVCFSACLAREQARSSSNCVRGKCERVVDNVSRLKCCLWVIAAICQSPSDRSIQLPSTILLVQLMFLLVGPYGSLVGQTGLKSNMLNSPMLYIQIDVVKHISMRSTGAFSYKTHTTAIGIVLGGG